MTDQTEEGRIATIDEKIEAAVDKAIDKLREVLARQSLPGAREQSSETEPDQPASMAAEVRREVGRLQAEEARTQAEATRDAKLAEHDEKIKAQERTPREYRKATNWMGWATDKDR